MGTRFRVERFPGKAREVEILVAGHRVLGLRVDVQEEPP